MAKTYKCKKETVKKPILWMGVNTIEKKKMQIATPCKTNEFCKQLK